MSPAARAMGGRATGVGAGGLTVVTFATGGGDGGGANWMSGGGI